MEQIYEVSQKLNEEFRDYNKTLAKYGVSSTSFTSLEMDILNGKKVLVESRRLYKRLPSGRFSRVPYEATEENIHVRNYLCCVSAIPIFKDRVEKKYTKYGYIPYKLTCFSWGDGSIKSVREFKVMDV